MACPFRRWARAVNVSKGKENVALAGGDLGSYRLASESRASGTEQEGQAREDPEGGFAAVFDPFGRRRRTTPDVTVAQSCLSTVH